MPINENLRTYTATRREYENGNCSPVDIVDTFLSRAHNRSELNAFITLNDEHARIDAQQSANNFLNGKARLLEGMVVAVKDNISTKGLRTTCASKMLENFTPLYDATTVERLREHGAIIIGKTNLDEFAMGSSNETSAFGPVGHPLNKDFVPGGSSGGSAVSVADSMAHTSLGSDTGGSIRQPAAFCGVYGFKPTYGRISRYGLIAFASSLDQIGTFAHSLEDTALLFDALSGYDRRDTTSANKQPTTSRDTLNAALNDDVIIGILPDEILDGCSPDVMRIYSEALLKLKENGIKTVQVSLEGKNAWVPTYYILSSAEASSNLSRFDGIRYGFRADINSKSDINSASRAQGFGKEVQRRILLGTYVLSSGFYDAYYKKAQQARRIVSDGYATIFSQCSAILLPTTPTPAFKRGEKIDDPITMYLNDIFTVSANLAGLPAITLPVGQSSDDFPIGLQLQMPNFCDEELLTLSARLVDIFRNSTN